MKKSLLIILLSVLIFACNPDDNGLADDNEYSQYLTGDSISSDINFMSEELYENSNDPHSPSLKLKFVTTEIFPCINFSIITTEFIKENELIIRFEEILDSNICLTAFGPAISYVDLPENVNKIVLINGETIDKYTIEIDNQHILVSVIENSFTNSLFDNTFRYSENTFAYICGTNTDNANLYGEFLNLLLENPSLKEYTFDGNGRIPYPEISSGHWVDNPSKYFKFKNDSDFDELGQILNDFTINNISPNSGVSISLISWDNRKHYSWLN